MRLPGICCAALTITAVVAFGNVPPHAPLILEPSESAHAIDPGDVHMATAPFTDDDAGDQLACSDWEIRTEYGIVVWYARCAAGVLAVHIHLGDGTFVNPEGRLLGSTSYLVAVRFRDSSGDPETEWSNWTTRNFATGPGSSVQALEIIDVLSSPPPRVRDAGGSDVALAGGASLALTTERGELLLSFAQSITNPPELAHHGSVRVVVSSGAITLSIPEATVEFADDADVRRTIYLPAINLPASGSAAFWIAADGSSFEASAGDATPRFVKLARGADTPWRVADSQYRVERVVTGLQLPVNLAFVPSPLPDADAPLFYITELYGTIRVVLRDGTLRDYATGLLNFNPIGSFPGSGEHGTVGTAVDPDTGDLFVATVYEDSSFKHFPKVVRIHSNDGGRTASAVTTVLDMRDEPIGASHQISSVSIGYDGKLYVHLGDGFDIPAARSLASFRGKILRINRDGTAPTDNPFYDAADGIGAADYVLAYGFRNPFGGAWRAADASLYEVENGPEVDRLAKVTAGFDYQWSGSDDDMYAHAVFTWTPSVAPVNVAFIQHQTFGGSGFPAEAADHAFVTESGPTWVSGITPDGKRIRELAFDASGNVVSTRPFLEYSGTGYATVAALAAGPDGLYFSDLFPEQGSPLAHGANVYRVRHVGRVTIGAQVADDATRRVSFSSIVDVPGYANLRWDFGDGTGSTEANPLHSFPGNGPYDVKLSVTGAGGVEVDDFTRVQFPLAAGVGLTATYSDASGMLITRLDPNIDFNWETDAPVREEPFLDVTWSGEITPVVSALYTFEVQSDGAAVLRIDGDTIIDTHGNEVAPNPIRLEAGRHYRFSLQTDDNPMSGVTRLLWSAPGMAPCVVPRTAFYPLSVRRRAAGR